MIISKTLTTDEATLDSTPTYTPTHTPLCEQQSWCNQFKSIERITSCTLAHGSAFNVLVALCAPLVYTRDAMAEEQITVKCFVSGPQGIREASVICYNSFTFSNYLEMLSEVFQCRFDAFTYEDEECDLCVVENDVDVHNMIEWHKMSLGPLILHAAPVIPQYLHYEQPPQGQQEQGTDYPDGYHSVHLEIDPHDGAQQRMVAAGVDSPLVSAVDAHTLKVKPEDFGEPTVLGSGSAGTVFRSVYLPTQTIMAIKMIPLDASPEDQSQILQELDILHKCRSSYIIQYYGTFFADTRIHICTEYMDGGSLDQYGALVEPVVSTITYSILQGLQYLAMQKIMHRDVKPSNILVNTHGEIKLCDFGVSCQLEQSVTRTFVGTNVFMAPERVQHLAYDERSEVWSLGLTLFVLFTEQFPFNISGTPIELLQTIVNDEVCLLPDAFSPSAIEFVHKCLTKDVNERPTAGQLLHHPFVPQSREDERIATFNEWIAHVVVPHASAGQ
eukprot:m.152729 g.152729  ORF g.152729 m.152729 type:complete len:500 (+) comp14271_c0_seq1:112-1611(+)